MPTYVARASWDGSLEQGSGKLCVGSGALEGRISPRPKEGTVTNPEEVVGAALASCYSLMLAKTLGEAEHPPKAIRTTAAVDLQQEDGRPHIPSISLDVEVIADGIDDQQLERIARQANEACPVSQALGGTQIRINASLA